MNYSVCVDALYSGRDITKVMQEVKSLGFNTIEFWAWWDKDIAVVKERLNTLDMKTATFCTNFISLVDPSKHDAYIKGLEETLKTASELGVSRIISQVGNDTGQPKEEQHRYLIEGLRKCLPVLASYDIILMIEPLNTRIDHIGYYLSDSDEAFDIVKEIDSPYVKVLYDIYHQYVMGEAVEEKIQKNIAHIGHFHAAGYPGRHELTHGEMDYQKIFRTIEATGYDGYVGLEYFPEASPEIGLAEIN